MYLVVYGLRNAGLTDELAKGLVWLAGHGPWVTAVGTGFAAAILSSVMNNMPSVLIGALSIQQAPDLSPLTPRADGLRQRDRLRPRSEVHADRQPRHPALAARPRQQGPEDHLGQYMKVGLVITPPVLLVTLLALAAWLPLLGTR